MFSCWSKSQNNQGWSSSKVLFKAIIPVRNWGPGTAIGIKKVLA